MDYGLEFLLKLESTRRGAIAAKMVATPRKLNVKMLDHSEPPVSEENKKSEFPMTRMSGHDIVVAIKKNAQAASMILSMNPNLAVKTLTAAATPKIIVKGMLMMATGNTSPKILSIYPPGLSPA